MANAEAILVTSSQKEALKSKEWAALLEQTRMPQRKQGAEPKGEEGELNTEPNALRKKWNHLVMTR